MKGYCKECKQNVEGVKPDSGSWAGVIFFMILVLLIGGIVWFFVGMIILAALCMIASLFAPKNICPICGMKIE